MVPPVPWYGLDQVPCCRYAERVRFNGVWSYTEQTFAVKCDAVPCCRFRLPSFWRDEKDVYGKIIFTIFTNNSCLRNQQFFLEFLKKIFGGLCLPPPNICCQIRSLRTPRSTRPPYFKNWDRKAQDPNYTFWVFGRFQSYSRLLVHRTWILHQ